MEIRVHLKVCEGCGRLWYRHQDRRNVYCNSCEAKLREFPAPATRKRRGRPARARIATLWAVAAAAGGAQ